MAITTHLFLILLRYCSWWHHPFHSYYIHLYFRPFLHLPSWGPSGCLLWAKDIQLHGSSLLSETSQAGWMDSTMNKSKIQKSGQNFLILTVCVYIGSFRSPSHWLLGVASINELDDDTEVDVLRKQECGSVRVYLSPCLRLHAVVEYWFQYRISLGGTTALSFTPRHSLRGASATKRAASASCKVPRNLQIETHWRFMKIHSIHSIHHWHLTILTYFDYYCFGGPKTGKKGLTIPTKETPLQ